MQPETWIVKSRFVVNYFSDWNLNRYPSYRLSDRIFICFVSPEAFDVGGGLACPL